MKAAARRRRSFGASSGAKASDAETACLRGSAGKGRSADEGARSLRQAKTNFAETGRSHKEGSPQSRRAGDKLRNEPIGPLQTIKAVPLHNGRRYENHLYMTAASTQKPSPRSSRGRRDGSVIWRESPVTYGSLPTARAGCGETGRFFLLLAHRSVAPSVVQRGPILQFLS